MGILMTLDENFLGLLPREPIENRLSIFEPLELLAAHLMSVWIVGRFFDKRRLVEYGFRFNKSWWIDLLFGMFLGAFLVSGIFAVEFTAGWVDISRDHGSGMFSSFSGFSLILILFTFICGSISEEIWGRGYLIKNISEGLNKNNKGSINAVIIAGLISAIIFGAMHLTNPNASSTSTFALFLGGLLYTTAFLLTGELAIPIGYHITWNFFQSAVYGFPVSGYNIEGALIEQEISGPEIWTGGEFGPEAGILGMLARVTGILLILLWIRFRYKKIRIYRELAVWKGRESDKK
ncbi:MAG: CPBP family intramembrane metalloprotease [bacterium]|nr:CPBP family intramembrane metalloprotease [bacterium]